MSILEIAKMYPEQIGADVVIENSDIANKEKIMQQVKPVDRSQVPTAHGKKDDRKKVKTKSPLKPTADT
jgi:hypothetical protein